MTEYPIEVDMLIQHLCRLAYANDPTQNPFEASLAKEALEVWDAHRPKSSPDGVALGKKEVAVLIGLAMNGMSLKEVTGMKEHLGVEATEAKAERLLEFMESQGIPEMADEYAYVSVDKAIDYVLQTK